MKVTGTYLLFSPYRAVNPPPVSFIKVKQVMLRGKIIAVYSEIDIKQVNAPCLQV